MVGDAVGELGGVAIRDRRAAWMRIARDEARDERLTISAIQQQHSLIRSVGTPKDVPNLEPDAEAGSGSIRNEHIAVVQPRDVTLVDLTLGQARFGPFDIVFEQVRGQELVAIGLERRCQRPQSLDGAAIASNRAGQVDSQTVKLQGYLADATGASTGVLAARRPFSRSWMISI